jgi:hypothetical protein
MFAAALSRVPESIIKIQNLIMEISNKERSLWINFIFMSVRGSLPVTFCTRSRAPLVMFCAVVVSTAVSKINVYSTCYRIEYLNPSVQFSRIKCETNTCSVVQLAQGAASKILHDRVEICCRKKSSRTKNRVHTINRLLCVPIFRMTAR